MWSQFFFCFQDFTKLQMKGDTSLVWDSYDQVLAESPRRTWSAGRSRPQTPRLQKTLATSTEESSVSPPRNISPVKQLPSSSGRPGSPSPVKPSSSSVAPSSTTTRSKSPSPVRLNSPSPRKSNSSTRPSSASHRGRQHSSLERETHSPRVRNNNVVLVLLITHLV